MVFGRISTTLAALGLAAALSGCGATLPNLTTGSLFGGTAGSTPPAAPQVQNDPVSRAMQVGTTSARALKCGYNFDPIKLRTQFLATETAATASPADATRVGQVYDTAFNGVSKAVASQGEGYCSAAKTRAIKEALTRHLAGDYTPTPPEPQPAEEGLFGSGGGSSTSKGYEQRLPTDNRHD